MKSLFAPLLVASAIIVMSGIVHGIATDRWGPSDRLERSLATMGRVPMSFGDWVGEDAAYEPEAMARAGIQGAVHRRYRHKETREVVSFLLVCGRGGPISVHTPDVCYGGSGYRAIGGTTQREIDLGTQGKHQFRVDRFALPGEVSQSQLEVDLAWSRDGRTWEAPDHARLSLARAPALYKLYVVREFLPGPRAKASDPSDAFLRQALPELTRLLPSD